MVEHDTNKYSMLPEACGFPGTQHLFADRVRIVAGRHRAEHPRLPAGSGGVSNLPAHRAAKLELDPSKPRYIQSIRGFGYTVKDADAASRNLKRNVAEA